VQINWYANEKRIKLQ